MVGGRGGPGLDCEKSLSVNGGVDDGYDNTLAKTINSHYKAEVIHRCGAWRSSEAVEYAPSNG